LGPLSLSFNSTAQDIAQTIPLHDGSDIGCGGETMLNLTFDDQATSSISEGCGGLVHPKTEGGLDSLIGKSTEVHSQLSHEVAIFEIVKELTH